MIPMHMPGSKRNFSSLLPYGLDVTEVDGTDNLHAPASFIAETQEKASKLWGSESSFLLVNGSTGGILSAVRATGSGLVLMARNCHKSVYNAVELCRRKSFYLMPDEKDGFMGEITPDAVRKSLAEHPETTAVIITSPTYEGIVSDVHAISEICRSANVCLIVDEAHGAHFGFHPDLPSSAVSCGADIVIQSLHKTLPALTQTAILHCKEKYASAIARENAVFETSSPSFILLASAGECIRFIQSKEVFNQYCDRLDAIRSSLGKMRFLRLFTGENCFAYDKGKLVIQTDGTSLSGYQLASVLRNKYHIETEMAAPAYIVAMTSVCDSAENLNAFETALLEIDSQCESGTDTCSTPSMPLPFKNEEAYAVRDAVGTCIPIPESAGKESLEYVWAYPPGIPLLVPGEIIPAAFPQTWDAFQKLGSPLQKTRKEADLLVK